VVNDEAAGHQGGRPLEAYFAAVGAIVAIGGAAAAAVILVAQGDAVRPVAVALIAGGVLAGVVALGVVYRQVARPIAVLSEAVRGLRESPTREVPVIGPAQVATLSEEINRLTASLLQSGAERERAERSYADLFEGNPLPILLVEPATLDILDVNEATERALGYSRAELKAMRTSDLTVADRPEQAEELRRVRETQEPTLRFGPIGYRRKDGSLMRAAGTSYVVRYGDRRLRVAILEDVTEREKIERQMEQAQRLESLGQLAGGVAHDFNNLLTMILNVVGSLRASAASADAERDIDRIEKAAQSASRLTHQLLAFARRDVAARTVVDVSSELADLKDLLSRTIGSHVVLTMDLEAGSWPVALDRGQLEQIVINVSVNARDAMPKGGRLTITTRNAELDADEAHGRPELAPGRYVRLTITDTGTGMDRSTLERAFEPFFTTKPVGQGTGMGLATVYGIVTQLGGRVTIESEPGKGTTIKVLLPATTEKVAEKTAALRVAPARGSGTILVVEDYADLRELFEEILRGAGYEVVSAPDGAAAVALARDHRGRIDLLLTDIVMPSMLGTDLAELLRSEQPELRVLFMSGHAQPLSGAGTAVPAGAPLLQKPFLESELLDKLAEVLAGPVAAQVSA
jgi:PAS domain S-box-containing protein